MNQAFGIMDPGYFISRTDIISWINTSLKLNITKIEQLGSGAVYCQILDMMFPNTVPMARVQFNVKNEYDFINNLKILQNSFVKCGITQVIEVEKLSQCKYQDNLEMIQWLQRFFDSNGGCQSPDYDAEARRQGEMDFSFAEKIVIPQIYNVSSSDQGEQKEERPSTSNSKKVSIESKENVNTQPKFRDREEKKETQQSINQISSGKVEQKQTSPVSTTNPTPTIQTTAVQSQDTETVSQIQAIFEITDQNDTQKLKEIAEILKIKNFISSFESPSQFSVGSDGSVF